MTPQCPPLYITRVRVATRNPPAECDRASYLRFIGRITHLEGLTSTTFRLPSFPSLPSCLVFAVQTGPGLWTFCMCISLSFFLVCEPDSHYQDLSAVPRQNKANSDIPQPFGPVGEHAGGHNSGGNEAVWKKNQGQATTQRKPLFVTPSDQKNVPTKQTSPRSPGDPGVE